MWRAGGSKKVKRRDARVGETHSPADSIYDSHDVPGRSCPFAIPPKVNLLQSAELLSCGIKATDAS